MNTNIRKRGMDPLIKSFLLVFFFWIAAMPFAGLYLLLKNKRLIDRIWGWIFLVVGLGSWILLIFFQFK